MSLLAPFILQNQKNKILRVDPELMCHFQAQNGPLVLNIFFFFGTNRYYYFHLPIAPFHYAKFKKILTVDPEL